MFTATAKVPDVYGVKNKKQKLLAEEHDDFPEELGDCMLGECYFSLLTFSYS